MKGKKCLLSVLSFAVFLIALFIGFSGEKVSAADDFVGCTGLAPPASWFSDAKTPYSYILNGNPVTDNPVTPLTSAVFVASSSGGGQIQVYNKSVTMIKANGFYYTKVAKNGATNLSTIRRSGNFTNSQTTNIGFTSPGTSTPSTVSGQDNTNFWFYRIGSNTSYSLPCSTWGSVNYETSWDKSQGEKVPTPNPTKDCEAINIGCWIGKIYSGVIDSFQSLAEGLLAGITFLFVPDGDVMAFQFNELKEFMIDKLGFLAYPFEWIINMIDGVVGGINSDEAWGVGICGSHSSFDWGFPGVSGTQFFGSNVSVNFCGELANKLAGISRVLMPVFISYALIRAFKHKIDEVHRT